MKKMRHMKRKALVALVLSVTMLLTLMPGLVFGVSDAQSSPDTVSSPIDYPTVNFTDVAPFLPRSAVPPPGAPRPVPPVMPIPAAITAITAWQSTRPPFITRIPVPMTSRWRPTPPAARSSAPSPATSPTDVILVLDQSGSMGDDMEQLVYTAYSGNARQNSDLYEKQDNLWYKLSDGAMSPLPSPPGTTASNTPPSPTEEITKIMIGGPAQRTQISGITKMTFTPRSMANTRRSP